MNDYPEVVILLITYERTAIALKTINGIKEKIHYPKLSWHIADDGSNGNHVSSLINAIGPGYQVTVSNTGGHSVGRSMNLGIKEVLKRADMWLHWEDDWIPRFDIELIRCVDLLEQRQDIGMIRLGRLVPEGLRAVLTYNAGYIWWKLEKDPPKGWSWNGNASMRHRRFFDAYGVYPEGMTPGKTEEIYLYYRFNEINGPQVAWPAWLPYDICDHIGDPYSFKEEMEGVNKLSRREAAHIINKRLEVDNMVEKNTEEVVEDSAKFLYDKNWLEGQHGGDLDTTRCLLAAYAHLGMPRNMLDIGTKNGLAIEIGSKLGIECVGVDIALEKDKHKKNYHLLSRDITTDISEDLNKYGFEGKYDMIICWELAEHLEPEYSEHLVKTLVEHRNGFIIFTAAVPGQGGDGHINCQPHEYWRALFKKFGVDYHESLTLQLKETWKHCCGESTWYYSNIQIFGS